METLLGKRHYTWSRHFVTALRRCHHLEWLAQEIQEMCEMATHSNDTDSVKKYGTIENKNSTFFKVALKSAFV